MIDYLRTVLVLKLELYHDSFAYEFIERGDVEDNYIDFYIAILIYKMKIIDEKYGIIINPVQFNNFIKEL